MVAPSKSAGRRRLMALGDYVKKRGRVRKWRKFFDMTYWFTGFYLLPNLENGKSVPVNGGCGAAACMLGHAVNVPSLKRVGVGNVYDEHFRNIEFTLHGDEIAATDLCRQVFGINAKRVDQIFTADGYNIDDYYEFKKVTPAQAVKQLRRVVKEIDKNEGWPF